MTDILLRGIIKRPRSLGKRGRGGQTREDNNKKLNVEQMTDGRAAHRSKRDEVEE